MGNTDKQSFQASSVLQTLFKSHDKVLLCALNLVLPLTLCLFFLEREICHRGKTSENDPGWCFELQD